MQKRIAIFTAILILGLGTMAGVRSPSLTTTSSSTADSAAVAALADSAGVTAHADSATVAGTADGISDDSDTTYVGGEHVRIPGEDYIKSDVDTGLFATLRAARLGVAAIKNASGDFRYGVTVVSTTDSTLYPSRLVNLVQEPCNGFLRNSFMGTRLILKDQPDTAGCTLYGHYVTANSGINASGGLIFLSAQPDSGVHANLYSRMESLTEDANGQVATNIYTDGGHVRLMDGDTEVESLYVDLDHIILAGDSIYVNCPVLASGDGTWPDAVGASAAYQEIAAAGVIGILHSKRGPTGNAIVCIGDTSNADAPTDYFIALYQPEVPTKRMSSSRGILIDLQEKVSAGSALGIDIDFGTKVAGYPIDITADCNSAYHCNIYSRVAADSFATYNIWAEGGRNYIGPAYGSDDWARLHVDGTLAASDTLKLTSNQVCGKATLTAALDSVQVSSTIVKGNTAKAHIFLQEYGDWVGFARVLTTWDGGFTIQSSGDETSDMEVHWFVICDP